MIDALLDSVVTEVVAANYGYARHEQIDIRDSGKPPPDCGDVYIAVHQGASRQTADNSKDERFSFSLTLTMRVTGVPLDRIGDQMLARKLAKKIGFNRRADQLSNLLHMDWELLNLANNYLVEMNPSAPAVYGFCEPPRFRGMDIPTLVGGEWFDAEPEVDAMGLKAEMRFDDCRRMQALGTFA